LAEPETGRQTARETAGDASRGTSTRPRALLPVLVRRIGASGPLAWAILGLALAAAILLVAAELSTITKIEIGAADCVDRALGTDRDICETTGGERHSYAFVLLAAFGLLMAWGAAAGGSRPAALAMLAVGAVVLAIALLGDLPASDDTRGLDVKYTEVTAGAERGLTLEIAGAVMWLGAGALALLALRRARADDEQ
jgi:hypothetical protein